MRIIGYVNGTSTWLLEAHGLVQGDEICLVREAKEEISKLESQLVAGFYEEEHPFYTQGKPMHELQDLVDAEECNNLIRLIKEKNKEIKRLHKLCGRFAAALAVSYGLFAYTFYLVMK